MRRAALSLALAIVPAFMATPAEAYHLGGKKWPTHTITYHSSAKQYGFAIREAVRMWNTSGARIRFKAVKKSRAKLKIVYGGAGGPSGHATLGWTPVLTYRTWRGGALVGADSLPCGTKLQGHRIKCTKQGPVVWLDRVTRGQLRQPFYRHYMVHTVAHELGHSLGLRHNHPACSVMSYRRDRTCAQPPVPWQYRCREIERDDLKGVLKRYGGKARPPAPEFCESYTPPAAPTALTATFDPDLGTVVARWVNSASTNATQVFFAYAKDKCTPYDDTTPYRLGQPGAPDGDGFYPDEPGRYCVTVWAADQDDQNGPAVSVWVDVPA